VLISFLSDLHNFKRNLRVFERHEVNGNWSFVWEPSLLHSASHCLAATFVLQRIGSRSQFVRSKCVGESVVTQWAALSCRNSIWTRLRNAEHKWVLFPCYCFWIWSLPIRQTDRSGRTLYFLLYEALLKRNYSCISVVDTLCTIKLYVRYKDFVTPSSSPYLPDVKPHAS